MPGYVEPAGAASCDQPLPRSSVGTVSPARGVSPPPTFPRLRWALRAKNPWPNNGRSTPAQKAGLRYQRKVERAVRLLESQTENGPWFKYSVGGPQPSYCQPDILFPFTRNKWLIIEVKLRFTLAAYHQLHLYRHVLTKAFSDWKTAPSISICCITRSYDPATVPPGGIDLLYSLQELRYLPSPQVRLPVLIWRGN